MTLVDSSPPPSSPSGRGAVLAGEVIALRGSGALWWPAGRLLAVADLHLGRSERTARLGGPLLPPYEGRETVMRLAAEISALEPVCVVCLGDSFDDCAAAEALDSGVQEALGAAMTDRRWVWVTGNHDPQAPRALGGEAAETFRCGPFTFRHIARPGTDAGDGEVEGEISGHYHPKARFFHRGVRIAKPAFVEGRGRLILPAFGIYTGGLSATDPVFDRLVGPAARLWLTGSPMTCVPRAALA